jgi:hypothetical protein
VAIFVVAMQTPSVQAFHESYGITDEQLKTLTATNPEFRDGVNIINSIGNDLFVNCGTLSNMLKGNSEGGESYESYLLICDHNALYEQGMCLTHADIFSFCGEAGSLQTYLEDRNLVNRLPERTFLNLDGSVIESMTNLDLK